MEDNFAIKLSEKVWSNDQFHRDYSDLYLSNVFYSFTGQIHNSKPEYDRMVKLLKSAAILSMSPESNHRETAYRIASSCIRLYSNEYKNLSSVLEVVLGRLGNFPAINFMYKETRSAKKYDIPSALLMELVSHEGENTINIGSSHFTFTDFQIRLWNKIQTDQNISISAPTSAGKSFTLQKYLTDQIMKESIKFILYLVPTRALLGQVSETLSEALQLVQSEIPVITIPESREALSLTKAIFVLTQERAHALLEIDPEINFGIVVIDEAQTINAGARGVLLQVVIEKLISRNPSAKFLFGSPFSKNPDYFSYLFPQKIDQLTEKESPVAQNLIGVDTVEGNRKNAKLKLYIDKKTVDIADINFETEVFDDKSMFSYICFHLGRTSKNIVYAGSPGACEEIADKIGQWIDTSREKNTEEVPHEILEFSKFIREHIHPKYALADMVEKGVAFHYGKLPAILRKGIEDYFSDNPYLRFLVCTSTLLHGVNLPAKNLFLLKPSEGAEWLTKNAETLSAPSFWNLAGRAGRLGKDFEGNVFLINKDKWKNDPLTGEREQSIKASFYQVINSNGPEILQLAKSEKNALGDIENGATAESAFVKLYSDYKKGILDRTFAASPDIINEDFISSIKDAFQSLSFSVPDNIIESNIGISPHYQQKMFDYLLECIKKNDIDKLLPSHPLAENAYENYVRMFRRFELKFSDRKKASRIPLRLSAMSLAWMRGQPYPVIIAKQEELYPKKGLQTLIRETMDTIETQIRFKCVKETKCYIDLLKFALLSSKLEAQIAAIPALPLYLEIGACSGTMINLIGMGFTRTTAGLINIIAADKSMDRDACFRWLKRQNWETSNLPKISKREILSIVSAS